MESLKSPGAARPEETAPQGEGKGVTGSVWDHFDVSKIVGSGEQLHFVPPEIREGRTFCKITKEDVQFELEHWKTAVICYVVGANPSFPVLQGYFKRIWGKHGNNKIVLIRNGIVVVKFDSLQSRDVVLEAGFVHFDDKPVVVAPWVECCDSIRGKITKVPTWIQFSGLNLKYWGASSLSKLASQIGQPLKTDLVTKMKDRGGYHRVLVMVELRSELVEEVWYEDEMGLLEEQSVPYEW